jgi:hypothetical protein
MVEEHSSGVETTKLVDMKERRLTLVQSWHLKNELLVKLSRASF